MLFLEAEVREGSAVELKPFADVLKTKEVARRAWNIPSLTKDWFENNCCGFGW
jgi:hypothetical protein